MQAHHAWSARTTVFLGTHRFAKTLLLEEKTMAKKTEAKNK